MVWRRRDVERARTPPHYHPDSNYMSLSIHYGGTFILVPKGKYNGGHVLIADYVDGQNITIKEVDDICSTIPGLSESRRYYIESSDGKGFVLLKNDGELVAQTMLFAGGSIAMPLFVDGVYCNPSQGEDNFDDAVELAVRRVKNSVGELWPSEEDDASYHGEVELTDDDSIFTEYVDPEVEDNLGAPADGTEFSENYGSFFLDQSDGYLQSHEQTTVNSEEELVAEPSETQFMSSDDSDFNEEAENQVHEDDDKNFTCYVDADVSDELVDELEMLNSEDEVVGSDVELDEHALSDDEGNLPQFVMFDMKNIWNPYFFVGLVFVSKTDFTKAITSHAIMTRRNLRINRNDPQRVYACCRAEDCEWRIHLIKRMNETGFFIREYIVDHTCAPTSECKNMNSTWLSERYLHLFRSDPKRKAEAFRVDVIHELRVNVSKDQAYRAKRLALKALHGKPDLQYTKLWEYAEELRKTNPGSTIILGTDNSSGEPRFSRFYVCFKACKDGFNRGCRPIIGVDGCHLKGPHGGVLLSAVGVDANNSIYPVAVAVVNVERTETWSWFLTVLKRDLDIARDESFTIMSDKQKGLVNAIAEVFPGSPNRFCVRHLLNNFVKAGFRGAAYKNALWSLAKATTLGQFRSNMIKLNALDEKAAFWLGERGPEQWSWAFFSGDSKSDMLLNNCCESFNSTILEARDQPIITMMEWIREHLMKKLQEGRDDCNSWKGNLCPKIKSILNEHVQRVADCIPIKADDTHYQISTADGAMYAVDLGTMNCTCRKWELSGIPCHHAISAINKQKLDPEDFVDPCYRVETYKKAYAPVIYPISGQEIWSQSVFIPPLPPNFGRGIGRPRRTRRREPDEILPHRRRRARGRQPLIALRRQTPTVHCSTCGEPGHNVRACPERPEYDEASEEAQRKRLKRKEKQVQRSLFREATSRQGPQAPSYPFGEGTSRQGTMGTTSTVVLNHHSQNENVELTEGITSTTVLNEQSHNANSSRSTQIQPPTKEVPKEFNEGDNTPTANDSIHTSWMTPQTTIPGPSMYDQMLMGQPSLCAAQNLPPRQPHVLQTRVNIRAPPPIAGGTFSTRLFMPTPQRRAVGIHLDQGQKFVNLSDLMVPDTQPTQASASKKK